MKQSKNDSVIEELTSTTNPVERDQLLQKFGLIEPKLTPQEQADIMLESGGYNVNGGYAFV
jgi:hypothetical protein